MTPITDNETSISLTAIATVRVPRASETDIETGAQRQLSTVDGITAVTIESLEDIEPRLSATVVRITVSIESAVPVTELRDQVVESVSIDSFEHLDSLPA